jgi:hypothetical protein
MFGVKHKTLGCCLSADLISLGINRGSEDGFEDGGSDGNIDGS